MSEHSKRNNMGRHKTSFENVSSLKLGFRRVEAAAAVGSIQLLDDMEGAGWLTPVVNRHKLKIFDRGDIQRAWARILAGEQPPQRDRRAKNNATSVAKLAARNGGPENE